MPPLVRQPATRSDAARFEAPGFSPSGLAFDAVSQRFVIGDAREHKLMVVTVGGGDPIDMVRADSAGFAAISAVETDGRRGELWVAGDAGVVHRLQLVSGRPLRTYRPSPTLGAVRLVDLGLAVSGTLMGLDTKGARLLTMGRGGTEWRVSLCLERAGVTSIAVEEDGLVFVAHEGGIVRADLRSREVTPLSAVSEVDLRGIERLRFGAQGLVAIQREASGTRRVLVLRLADGRRRVTRIAVADEDPAPLAGLASIHLTGPDLYYLAREPRSEPEREPRYAVRKVTLPR
ncbi:MAG: hypothetical protein FJW27_08925 [Acidimicrobiia bacterium]|nr:hypothetical protein [Acidimicrobiia bacterium]